MDSNKKTVMIVAGVAALLLGVIAVLALTLKPSNTPGGEGGDDGDQPVVSLNVEPPKFENVSVVIEGKKTVISGDVAAKHNVEYEVSDMNRRVVAQATVPAGKVDVVTETTGTTLYRVKVRAVDGDKYSAWSSPLKVELENVKGIVNLEPHPSYFKTAWALGEEASEDRFREAMQTSYGAVEASPEAMGSKICLALNSGVMTPGLLLPPSPAIGPRDWALTYVIDRYDPAGVNLSYYWCVT